MMRRLLFVGAWMCLAFTARAQAPFWTPAAGPYGGVDVQALAATPGGDLVAGTRSSVFRSTDGGASWQSFSDGLPDGEVRALQAMPDGTLFAGLYGPGVYTRVPGAATWEASGLRGVLTTALLATPDGTLFAGTRGGLLRSDNGGRDWQVLPFFNRIDGGVQALAALETDVFAATRQGVYRSADGGRSWQAASTGLLHLDVTALTANDDGELFAGTTPAAGGAGIFRSRNRGGLWTSLPLPADPIGVYALATAPDGTLFAGGYRVVLRSSNGGDTWTQQAVAPVPVQAFAFAAAGTFAATAGRGVFRADERDGSWREANQGLLSTVYDLLLGAAGTVYAATAGGVFRTTDYGRSWTRLGEGLTTVAAHTLALDAGGRLLAGTTRGVFRYDDGTQAWQPIGPPGDPSVRDLAVAPDGAVYAGYFAGVYRLRAPGVWDRFPVIGPDGAARDILAVEVNEEGVVFAGSYWDAFRSNPNPIDWVPMDLLPTAAEGAQAFLRHQGALYAGTRYSGVVRSTDGGLTWTQRVGGLTGLEDVRAFGADARGRIYIGTYGSGVFRYDNNAETWRSINDGLAHRRVVALGFDAAGNAYAGTLGGGVYRHLIPGVLDGADEPGMPHGLAVHGTYPNPFQGATTLRFDLPAAAFVRVDVFDLLGRRVLAVPERYLAAGASQTLTVEADALAAGLYLYRVTARAAGTQWQATGRMMRVR